MDEVKPFKVFEIGIAAPALLAGAVTTAQLAPPRAEHEPASGFAVVARAYAQSPGKEAVAGVKTYTPPQQGRWGEFIEGLAGITPRNVWYVRVGSAATVGDARQLAANVEQRLPKLEAEVFRSDDGRGYDVVIGRQLDKSPAQALRDRAVRAGLAETEAFIPRSIQYGR
jgi:hypothetical protein